MSRRRLHLWLLPLSVAGFLVMTIGSDVFARIYVNGTSIETAFGLVASDPATNILGFALLMLPVIGAHFLSVEFARIVGIYWGYLLLTFVLVALALLYGFSYIESLQAMRSEKWTAASLSLGLLPVKGALILIVPAAVMLVVQKRARKR